MFRYSVTAAVATAWLALGAGIAHAQAGNHGRTLVVTMTNAADANQINVYDADTHALLQTVSTQGRGGAGGNARGIRQNGNGLVAAVNFGSNSVALFRRAGDVLKFDKLVTTTSAPVSLDFGNDHLYVAGATTVDSFLIRENSVLWLDGTADLVLAGGGAPPSGSTSQVGVLDEAQLLVTLKADPDPGTVDIVRLRDGAVSGDAPAAASAPAGSLAPFGFATYPDGTALITLAHSNQDGLFRDGAFTAVVDAQQQQASCWMTRVGKYVFVANTGSGTISRVVGTGQHVFVDAPVAATITTGGAPADLDAGNGVLGVVDHIGGQSHLSLFAYNGFGELTAAGSPITVGAPGANGVAIVAPAAGESR
jgi:hypothetical protein